MLHKRLVTTQVSPVNLKVFQTGNLDEISLQLLLRIWQKFNMSIEYQHTVWRLRKKRIEKHKQCENTKMKLEQNVFISNVIWRQTFL